MRFVAFDVETPNAANDRMSAIGAAVVEDGEVVSTFSSLVDPEVHFDLFNIRLTGITPDRVRTAPNFAALWTELGPLLQSGVLVAHNAPFDLRVLSCCLKRKRFRQRSRRNLYVQKRRDQGPGAGAGLQHGDKVGG